MNLQSVSRSKLYGKETPVQNYESLSHTKWECKYHVIFIPKYRGKKLYKQIRQDLGELFHDPARRKESRIEEGHLLNDHIHMMTCWCKVVAGLVLVIPPEFGRRLSSNRPVPVQALVDRADSNFAVHGLNYLQRATALYAASFVRVAPGPGVIGMGSGNSRPGSRQISQKAGLIRILQRDSRERGFGVRRLREANQVGQQSPCTLCL
jgi:hypothetical protein